MYLMIGVFGGTFNPIHNGHCRSAIELIYSLGLQKLHIIPCGLPPHREAPQVGAEHRLAMVQAAMVNEPSIVVDDREIVQDGPSYSLLTVKSLAEQYRNIPIALIIGDDAFRSFDSWYQWQSIMEYAHIVIMRRPHLPHKTDAIMSVELQNFVNERLVEDLQELKSRPNGSFYYQSVTQLEISSTKIRADIAAGKSARYLLPESVWQMIQENEFYQ